jgi:hypothetical protein
MRARRKLTKREVIQPHPGDKRYARRLAKGQPGGGQFTESVSLNKSLSVDDKRKAKHVAKPGEGDRGDEKQTKQSKRFHS